MTPFLQELLIAVATGLVGSGGTGLIVFLIQRHDQKKGNAKKQMDMILGIAHDRILWLGGKYIERGSISMQELDDFNKYLYEPYAAIGGNGSGETVWKRVNKLPIIDHEAEENS